MDNLRCVHCGFRVKTLFVQYSPGNIRLMKCENCKAVADEYIECEFMILLIDLILHKRKAYRHLLFNMLHRDAVDVEGILWKSSFVFLLLDACRNMLLYKSKEDWGPFTSSVLSMCACGQMMMEVFIGNFIFLCAILLAIRLLMNSSSEITRYKEVLLAILVSSYFKIFLIPMMVWEFPSSVIPIIDIFILSSNTVALKVLPQSTITGCMGLCFAAHATKFLTSRALEAPLSVILRYCSILPC